MTNDPKSCNEYIRFREALNRLLDHAIGVEVFCDEVMKLDGFSTSFDTCWQSSCQTKRGSCFDEMYSISVRFMGSSWRMKSNESCGVVTF